MSTPHDIAAELCEIVHATDLYAWLGVSPTEGPRALKAALWSRRKYLQGMQSNPKYRDEATFVIRNHAVLEGVLDDVGAYLTDLARRQDQRRVEVLDKALAALLDTGAVADDNDPAVTDLFRSFKLSDDEVRGVKARVRRARQGPTSPKDDETTEVEDSLGYLVHPTTEPPPERSLLAQTPPPLALEPALPAPRPPRPQRPSTPPPAAGPRPWPFVAALLLAGLVAVPLLALGLLYVVAGTGTPEPSPAPAPTPLAPAPLAPAPLAPAPLELRLDSTPRGAEVYDDDRRVGTTPIRLASDGRPHRYELRLAGYEPALIALPPLTASETRQVALVPVPAPQAQPQPLPEVPTPPPRPSAPRRQPRAEAPAPEIPQGPAPEVPPTADGYLGLPEDMR